jgi:hypothetical protein
MAMAHFEILWSFGTLAEYVKYAVAFGPKRKKTKTAYIRIPGISIGLTSDTQVAGERQQP